MHKAAHSLTMIRPLISTTPQPPNQRRGLEKEDEPENRKYVREPSTAPFCIERERHLDAILAILIVARPSSSVAKP
jgi:hypothetical protein